MAALPTGHQPLVWPPPPDTVVKHGWKVLLALAVPAAVATYSGAHQPISDKERQWLTEELEQRKKRLREILEKSKALLAGEESARLRISGRELLTACSAVDQLSPGDGALSESLLCTAQLLKHEVLLANQETNAGTVARYRDGSELEKVLKSVEGLRALCRKSRRLAASKQLLSAIEELRSPEQSGTRTLRKLQSSDLSKALKLLALVKASLPFVGLTALMSMGVGVLKAAEVYYRAQSLEVFRSQGFHWGTFRRLTAALSITKGMALCLEVLQSRCEAWGDRQIAIALRTEMYRALLRQDFEWYRLGQKDERNVHEILGKTVFSLPVEVSAFLKAPRQLMDLLANVTAQAAVIRQRSSRLLYAMVALHWLQLGLNSGIRWLKRMALDTISHANPQPDNSLWMEPLLPQNLPTVRSFAAEGKALANWHVFWHQGNRVEQQRVSTEHAFAPLSQVCTEATTIAEEAWCGHLVQSGDVPAGEVESLMHYARNISQTFRGAYTDVQRMQTTLRPLAQAWDLLSVHPSIGIEGGRTPQSRARGEIAFEGVSFSYPGSTSAASPLVLQDVSFTVAAGSVCGLTGSSGGGKSTLIQLLERFYDPCKGKILLDGEDIRSLNPSWLRRQISVVSQRPRLFKVSLYENLTYGCDTPKTQAQVEEACRAANIYHLVFENPQRFPSGLHSHVSGDVLSGGELQRVAIARALLADSPILVLDEATSALDSESQSLVSQALDRVMVGRTVLSIAHRLETIKSADWIICLRGGKVVEQGTHTDLVSLGGHYAQLYNEQIESTSVGAQLSQSQAKDETHARPRFFNDAPEAHMDTEETTRHVKTTEDQNDEECTPRMKELRKASSRVLQA
eukprot:TRINITY_DN35609_c0_g1_i1.p1 TRINITY_DN35609_c0_g1~~TRINITY_DN35609_c0_g1_i1.p1  ORF type:complete len:855 (+),score=158.11 TRINITY_DN35609_c0_g1_i1:158-2722(+)